MPRLLRFVVPFVLLATLLGVLVYNLSWHPDEREPAPVMCNAKDVPAPTLIPGQTLKVMTWNIQHLAGKRYVFWYDMPDRSGPDERPTAQDLAYNLDEVARVIRDEHPDIVLLQQVNDGAKNTDYSDQLMLLQARVTDLLPCSSQAFDWKADFVADPHIFGSVGSKLATLSRFRIDKAERVQLPASNSNVLARQFQPKQAVLVSYLPLRDGGQMAVMNTRLSEYRQGDDTLRRQEEAVRALVDSFEQSSTLWITGGDLRLHPKGQGEPELAAAWSQYSMIPAYEDIKGSERRKWYTRFPNDPRISGPDRTQDYLFHSPKLQRVDARVRQDDTLLISDHFPVIARFLLPVQE